ncbi:hypothetical protein EDD15DRAFT_2174690 [Pisolithus albus]|nr:hypothetical protein EDD15DRAFT_2174690 [Pisolithus albus]
MISRQLCPTSLPDIKPAGTTLCTGKINPATCLNSRLSCHAAWGNKDINLTLAAPEWFHPHHGEHAYRPGVYASRDEYVDAIAAAHHRALEVLYTVRLCNAQFDDPPLAYFCVQPMLRARQELGEDSEALLDHYIQLYSACLACRWVAFSVRDISADLTLGHIGTFEPLRYLPKNKTLILTA